MNPVDHPHGGGRGKRKGRISQTPWGMPTKGYKTRKKKARTDPLIHLSRHAAKAQRQRCTSGGCANIISSSAQG